MAHYWIAGFVTFLFLAERLLKMKFGLLTRCNKIGFGYAGDSLSYQCSRAESRKTAGLSGVYKFNFVYFLKNFAGGL